MPVDFPVSWTEFHSISKKLSSILRESGREWSRVIAVTRGGMMPACLVASDLGIRNIDTVSVQSYDHQAQSEVKILKSPDAIGTGAGCLIVDDLSDTGNTFLALRKIYRDATYACLYVKPQGKPQADFYVDEVSQDTWIYLPWEDNDFPPHIRDIIGNHLK